MRIRFVFTIHMVLRLNVGCVLDAIIFMDKIVAIFIWLFYDNFTINVNVNVNVQPVSCRFIWKGVCDASARGEMVAENHCEHKKRTHIKKIERACKKKKNRISHSVWNASCMWGSLCCCYTILNHNIRRNEVYYMYALYLFPYRRLIDGVLLAQIQNAHTDCSGEEHLYFFKCSVKTVVYDTYISKYMHI